MHRWGGIVVGFFIALVCAVTPASALAGGYHVTQVWGEYGKGEGQLRAPKGVAMWRDGSVWTVDYDNETLLKYSAAGDLLGCWGGLGSAPGKFYRPSRLAIGPDGTVYVTDADNQRIERFSQSGKYLGQWGRPGTGPGEFAHPRGIDVALDGTVYVTDQSNHRVQVFTARGRFLRQWGTKGRGRGQFIFPKDVAVSGDGRVYVADSRTDRVQIFTRTGRWLGSFGGEGTGRGRLRGPRGLGVDARGHVFVADALNHRVEEFTRGGGFVRDLGFKGSMDGMFLQPRDVAQAPDGSIVVVDTFNHRLQRFVKDDSADDSAPVTRCDQPAGWSATPLAVTLSAIDQGSGVAATYLDVDGGRFRPVDGAVGLDKQGRHVVCYLSVDQAGNQEVVRRRVFILDWTRPGVRLGTRTLLRALSGADVPLHIRVADELSPTCRLYVRLYRDGTEVSRRSLGRVPVSPSGRIVRTTVAAPRRAGRYVVTVAARDRAGNVGRRSLDLVVRSR